MKTAELKDAALDWAVCEATGLLDAYPLTRKRFLKQWSGNSSKFLYPSTDWAQGGPIIEREGMHIEGPSRSVGGKTWHVYSETGKFVGSGPTLLIAAMRCYVASKLGDEVEVPDEI